MQADYTEVCRGRAIFDALKDIRRMLERQHPGIALAEDIVTALAHALEGAEPPLSVVLSRVRMHTGVDFRDALTKALQRQGIEITEFG